MPVTLTKPALRTASRRAPSLYTASAARPVLVRVPAMKFLTVSGRGDPSSSPAFQEAIQALFTLSYGAKFRLKRLGDRREYPIKALEGLFWIPGMKTPLTQGPPDPDLWRWKLMIAQPSFVTAQLIDQVREDALAKKPLGALRRVRLERFAEGLAAQILHVGPYDAEGPTIARLVDFMTERGVRPRGRHHEIYLNDPRRVGPARTKTIIRQPVRELEGLKEKARG